MLIYVSVSNLKRVHKTVSEVEQLIKTNKWGIDTIPGATVLVDSRGIIQAYVYGLEGAKV